MVVRVARAMRSFLPLIRSDPRAAHRSHPGREIDGDQGKTYTLPIIMQSVRRSPGHPPRLPLPSFSRQELSLIGITMIWGGTFLVVHIAMEHSGALFFVGVRFLWAACVTLVLFRKHMAGIRWSDVGAGAAVGLALTLGYALQTYGMKTIPASQSAFITALYVPAVPLLQWLLLRHPPRIMQWGGIACAFTGLFLLADPTAPGNGGAVLSPGEIATVLSAVALAMVIILIGRFAPHVDSRRFTVIQLFAAGTFSLALMPLTGETIPAFSWGWAGCAIILGLVSALIQPVMNWAQKTVSPTRATVIYAGEPVWGGIFGRLAGDRLPALALAGGALIVLGVLVSEIRPGRKSRPQLKPALPEDRSAYPAE